jgi:hypothetical protein
MNQQRFFFGEKYEPESRALPNKMLLNYHQFSTQVS